MFVIIAVSNIGREDRDEYSCQGSREVEASDWKPDQRKHEENHPRA